MKRLIRTLELTASGQSSHVNPSHLIGVIIILLFNGRGMVTELSVDRGGMACTMNKAHRELTTI